MEVKVPKEIRDYQESIFFGLSTRQFICSLLAVGAAVGLYFGLRPLVGSEEVGWICILGASPFAACGFFKYHGMTAEQVGEKPPRKRKKHKPQPPAGKGQEG